MISSRLLIQNWKVRKDSKAKISKKEGCLKRMQKRMAQAPLCKQKAQQRSLTMTRISCQDQYLNIFPSVLSVRELGKKKPNS